MRQPVKMMDVYKRLKKTIEDGVYPAGGFLPSEIMLARNLGISRDTLRGVLTKLAEEKLIERMYPKGTMVCDKGRKNFQVPLTFLLPCPDFISETFLDMSAQNTRRIFKGVSQIAFEYDYRVEAVPVSPTNNEHDIDWRKLDFVNADSMLVVPSDWYRDLFPLLLERGCRVAFINSHISHRKEDADFINSCFRITINAFGAAEAAVEHLFRQGCRRIALFHQYILEPEHPIMEGYISGLRKCGLTFAAWHELPEENLIRESVRRELKDFYKKSGGFDSMIISPGVVVDLHMHNLYQDLGLTEDIKVIVSNDIANNRWVTPPLTGMAFTYEDVGRIAVQRLLSPEFSPGEQLISASLVERESTLAEKYNFALA